MIPIRMTGPMARYTGYAVGFRGLVRRLLEREELDIDLRATRDSVPDGTEPELLELLKRGRDHGRLGVITGFPPFIANLDTRYKVLYSMYEADDLPFDWRSYVERANEVWVPTVFCARVFGQYNRRIRILPWGIDERVFCRGRGGKRGCNDEFTFGAVGVQSPRKGTDVLVKAFGLAFGGRAGVRLIIKTRDTRSMPAIDNPQIEVITDDWPEERLVQLYRDMDCLVEASRGEGVGMPPLQAAMCGTPSLVTNWSGPQDFLNDKGIYGINIKGLSRADNIGAIGAHWAEPDERHLALLMRRMVEERPDVKGSYDRWTLASMADHFTDYAKYSWQAANR